MRLHTRDIFRQNAPMGLLWEYIGQVLSFALRRSTFRVDVMQILTASLLPALGVFAGIKMPETTSQIALAYIGLAASCFILLRLFSAPYFIWKKQTGEAASLKLELSKPERIQQEQMALARAKAKMKIASIIKKLIIVATQSAVDKNNYRTSIYLNQAYELFHKGVVLQGKANSSQSFHNGFNDFFEVTQGYIIDKVVNDDMYGKLSGNLCEYLHGDITAEDLALRLPQGIGSKKQP